MKLLIVDDHMVVLEGIAALLGQSPLTPEVLRATDVESALRIARENDDLDAVLLDLRMPGMDGKSALRLLGQEHPTLPVLILSSSEDPEDVRQAFALGALGYVAKSASATTLLGAFNLVLAGELYVPSFMMRSQHLFSARPDALTPRQGEVLEMLRARLSNREIAERLELSEKTVKAHVTAILRSLGVSSRNEIARAASVR